MSTLETFAIIIAVIVVAAAGYYVMRPSANKPQEAASASGLFRITQKV